MCDHITAGGAGACPWGTLRTAQNTRLPPSQGRARELPRLRHNSDSHPVWVEGCCWEACNFDGATYVICTSFPMRKGKTKRASEDCGKNSTR